MYWTWGGKGSQKSEAPTGFYHPAMGPGGLQ